MEATMRLGVWTASPNVTEKRTRHTRGSVATGLRMVRTLREHADIELAVTRFGDTVMRVCAIYLREPADRDDAFQETFLRYARYERSFNGDEHRKAWLIRVASNVCKDQLKRASSRVESLDALTEEGYAVRGDDGEEGQRELESEDLLKALQRIDERYAIVLYLRFYENYSAVQIGKLLGMPENTVYTCVARGKRQLKGVLGHE